MTRIIFCLWLVLFLLPADAFAGDPPQTVAGYPVEEALRLGERMYRQGVLPSGEAMEAIVQKDIPVDGTMFTCESCHLRSGLGSVEGSVITLPTNGADLYRDYPMGSEVIRPMRKEFADQFQKDYLRPAYSDETLAAALLWGLDPAGRELDQVMPRYSMNERDMEVMIYYLKHLSADFSPGVDETTIKFATVITDEVPAETREAMMSFLDAYIRDKNVQSRHQEERAKEGVFYKLEFYTAYRRVELKKWELHGEPATWGDQLEEYYKKEPVFGFVGGISTREWKPIHDFCEKNRIPCLFPLTDFPVISDTDWYTQYFSKGLYQEGETAARYLRGTADFKPVKVLQVFRDDVEGRYLANGFQDTWKLLGQGEPANKILQPQEALGSDFWKQLVDEFQADIVLLWLKQSDLAAIDKLADTPGRPRMVFVSSSQQDKALYALPESMLDFIYITYPYDLPQDGARKKLALQSWLKIKKLPLTDIVLQGKVFFLGRTLTGVLTYMRRDFYRERFMEGVDMMIDQNYTIPVYPNLSFGPAQRYASKGCYVVQLTKGSDPRLETKSNWINH